MPASNVTCLAATCSTTWLGEALLQSYVACAWCCDHTELRLGGGLSGALLLLAPLQELLHILVLQSHSVAQIRQAVSSTAS